MTAIYSQLRPLAGDITVTLKKIKNVKQSLFNMLYYFVAGLKILGFLYRGVPVQFRPGAPSSFFKSKLNAIPPLKTWVYSAFFISKFKQKYAKGLALKQPFTAIERQSRPSSGDTMASRFQILTAQNISKNISDRWPFWPFSARSGGIYG